MSLARLVLWLVVAYAAGACPQAPVPAAHDAAVDADAAAAAEVGSPEVAGSDASRVCTPGVLGCAGPMTASVCNDEGSAYDTTPCESGLTCWPDSGTCKLPNCDPGARECRGVDSFRVCGEYGIQWGDTLECPTDTVCIDGECAGCPVGAVECLSSLTYRECGADGVWAEELACGEDKGCASDECCNFTGACNGDGEAVALCITDDGTVLQDETTPCAQGTQCYNGTCVSCIPGTTQCSGDAYQECLPSGLEFGPTTACPTGEVCVGGACTVDGCLPRVLLVVDRSGSMSSDWSDVIASVDALSQNNPGYYGLIAFPGTLDSCAAPDELDVPMALNNSFALNLWMSNANVTGATPLLEVMDKLVWLAPTALGGKPGTVVVLSDGDDSCASGNITGQLGDIAATLNNQYAIVTYAIGYGYDQAGDSAELNALISKGGSGQAQHIVAGSEAELTDVFQGIIDDIKYCD